MAEIKDGKSFFVVSRLLVSMRALMDIVPNNIPEEDMTVLINVNKLYQAELKGFISAVERLLPNVQDEVLKADLTELLDFTIKMDQASGGESV